ncbi:Carboxylesterase NlhH [Microbacterium azadirachtae]|uniref:Carboxylesterase NlhH n=1 Tax=Microbacterium azadirachtae TaxID=582680 RepID=A0A0F0KKY0_9MICO|nr:alpha/beta hydrolase [Microbacterium azadirachtae]KJL21557.1 Carboxylesterase NlhH [Microbacterium azadirachtae]
MPRGSRYRRPMLDRAVAAHEAQTAALLAPEPKDPAGRRRVAGENDTAVSAALGVSPLHTATAEHTVPVAGHPDVRVRVYWPGPEPAPRDAGLPILVYFYGGGFTIAGIDWVSWDARFRERARDAGIIIVAADYAHAPEQRFPTQPEQCWSAWEWTHARAEELGGSRDRLAVGGASSGGDLAAAVTLMNRDRAAHPIALQLLENPALDLTIGHADARGVSARMPGVIVRKAGRMLVRQYVGDDTKAARNPYASPLLADSHAGLPPALIITSELDPLRGDGEAYARALSDAGVDVTAVRFIGQTHGSLGATGFVTAADVAHRLIVTELRRLRADS